jgi:glycosyltransferase involved in cell wall biosynthesis
MGDQLTVVVCTHNRGWSLASCLDALVEQELAPDHYSILVVDNASVDSTKEIVETYQRKFRNISYLCEPKLGLSFARNSGLSCAKSPIVSYVDDDIIVDHDWAKSILRAYEIIKPMPVAVGGKILLKWKNRRPKWMHEKLLSLLGYFDAGDQIVPVKHINGGNMSFSRNILLRLGGFNPALGKRGGSRFTSEESDLQLRMREVGYIIHYQPDAVGWHLLDEECEIPQHVIKRFYYHGVSDFLRYLIPGWPGRTKLLKLMLRQIYLQKSLLPHIKQLLLTSNLQSRSQEFVYLQCKIAEVFGFEWQLIRAILQVSQADLRGDSKVSNL